MINVIASIRVKAGRLSDFLEIFKANMIKVREERGCIEYFPTVDIDAELPPQILDENVDAFHAHQFRVKRRRASMVTPRQARLEEMTELDAWDK